eukprot:1157505-Pelagomonas_calceolata.AAC.7
MRQSRTRKHKQLRKRDISARPAAGLPIAHPHPARRSARLRPSGLSCTGSCPYFFPNLKKSSDNEIEQLNQPGLEAEAVN